MKFKTTQFREIRSKGRIRCPQASTSGGFALVIALSLMAFVLLLILSISTLVQVEQASSANTVARMKARQAALLSLDLAMGKLQETAGLDQRVTAPASAAAGIAGDDNGPKQLTGVWRSWEGLDHDKSTGFPKKPDYDSKMDTGVPDIDSTAPERFLGWLVSSAYDPASSDYLAGADAPPSLTNETSTVPLLASGSVIPNPDPIDVNESEDVEVYVVPTEIEDGSAAIAWWISGENTKALLREKDEIVSGVDEWVKWGDRLSSSAGPDVNEFKITDVEDLGRVVNRTSLNLMDNTIPTGSTVSSTYFHDLTGYARGLLTNTANGGWRRDISLMAEQWETLASPDGGATYPFYTRSPGDETEALLNSGNVGGLIYPWSEQLNFAAENSSGKLAGGPSVGWAALADFANQYKQITSGDASGNVTFSAGSSLVGPGVYQMSTEARRDSIVRSPVLARMHWVLKFESKLLTGTDATDDPTNTHGAYLNLTPVVTFWNPYNVSIDAGGTNTNFWMRLQEQLPYKFKFNVGGVSQNGFFALDKLINKTSNTTLRFPADDEIWQPGEARVYSPRNRNGNDLNMQRGYENAVGISVRINLEEAQPNSDNDVPINGLADSLFTVELEGSGDFKCQVNEWPGTGGGTGNGRSNSASIHYNITAADAAIYWPTPDIANDIQKLNQLVVNGPSPFMIMMLQLHNITENSAGGRGYSHRKAISGVTSDQVDGYSKVAHLDAFPYDLIFKYPNPSAGTDGLPVDGITAEDPYSFIGTSHSSFDGLKSLIVGEIPTKPLRSLGDLQHFDVAYFNAVLPFVANPIGNSNASQWIEPDQVYIDNGAPTSQLASYDHSYVANHLFFDDWFVSSIAPETNGYDTYPAGSEIRGIEKVYSEFASGDVPLPNSAYKPADILSKTDASSAADDLIVDNTAWHSVASKLEVDGMFNVNSTSVEAWSAMLKHMREAKAPYVSNSTSGTTYSVELDVGSSDDNFVSRTSVAGDPAANFYGDPNDTLYTKVGMRKSLTNVQIEALATEIVKQVKERGPFLSLSEFVNRQLNTDNSASSLALAGAIESALVELSTKGVTENPFKDLQDTFADAVVPGGVGHLFAAAAEGNLAYGFPGWVRQADILRPLAPVLSARDDTFVIRAYGESKDPITGEAKSAAWCEAVVQRRADYVDPDADEATVLPSDGTLDSEANKRFGRRFRIVSFRWLSPDEV
ncbi:MULTISPECIES: hypothetical protein [unclassified Lentimonas]|uniref:hypothetical protein n=3 Tax=Lentimonas TaxID=417293 RepID=UPI001389DAD2|nr:MULTISPECIES: hypothetical protein [unclassified Lentimonas]